MSYGLLALSGIRSSSASSRRSAGSGVCRARRIVEIVEREEAEQLADRLEALGSQSCAKCATPDVPPWTSAPPSASNVTSSWVTVFTTLGPVTNM